MRLSRLRLGAALLTTTAAAAALALALPTHSAESQPLRPGGTQRPSPHVMDFAHGLASPAKPPAAHTDHQVVSPRLDGCDHAYGEVNQCVPAVFPPTVGTEPGARCAWLLAHGFHALTVHSRDDLSLDTDHDGIACDRGDAGGS